MPDKPIIFSTPMVRSLWDDRKTQTRRIINPQPKPCFTIRDDVAPDVFAEWLRSRRMPAPGDRLWVREAFAFASIAPIVETIDNPWPIYRAEDNRSDYGGPWKPSIHMPRWASRMTLIVKDVKVERLHEISLQDAFAEGCAIRQIDLFGADADGRRAIGAAYFANLWRSIHGPDAWDVNPWCAATSFRVIKANIDSPEARA